MWPSSDRTYLQSRPDRAWDLQDWAPRVSEAISADRSTYETSQPAPATGPDDEHVTRLVSMSDEHRPRIAGHQVRLNVQVSHHAAESVIQRTRHNNLRLTRPQLRRQRVDHFVRTIPVVGWAPGEDGDDAYAAAAARFVGCRAQRGDATK
jgi:hypothetical protein